jgi:hypothetical protein
MGWEEGKFVAGHRNRSGALKHGAEIRTGEAIQWIIGVDRYPFRDS